MTVKRQHLVFRKYLSLWTNDTNSTKGKTYVYDKETGKIRRNSIEDVAVESYAYDIGKRTQADEDLCKDYFNSWLIKIGFPYKIKNFVFAEKNREKDFLEVEYFSKIEKNGIAYLNKLNEGQFPFADENKLKDTCSSVSQDIANLALNDKSTLHGYEVENLFREILGLSSKKDDRFDFFEFFSNQFLRTSRGRAAVLDAIESTKERFPTAERFKDTTNCIFPMMTFINTFIFSFTFWKENYYLEIIQNDTDKNFITSDQPIINLCADYSETEKENATKPELYYPISPKMAVICKRGLPKNRKIRVSGEKRILRLNSKMFKAASRQVFGLSEDDFSNIEEN